MRDLVQTICINKESSVGFFLLQRRGGDYLIGHRRRRSVGVTKERFVARESSSTF